MALFRYFKDENVAQGVVGGANAPFQVGISNVDSGTQVEKGITIPWTVDQSVSWLDYNCWIEIRLDSGMVLHKILPQSQYPPDQLGQLDFNDVNLYTNTKGVNLKSAGTYKDFIQRMATSDYRFGLHGHAVRAGYQPPIPKIVTIAGLPATPDAIQNVRGPRIIANMSGIPIWAAQWELWYMVALPPKQDQVPPTNLALHIRGDQQLPQDIQVPFSVPDYNAVPAAPGIQTTNPGTVGG